MTGTENKRGQMKRKGGREQHYAIAFKKVMFQ